MCHSRTLNNKNNRLQERDLRIVYDDYEIKLQRTSGAGSLLYNTQKTYTCTL